MNSFSSFSGQVIPGGTSTLQCRYPVDISFIVDGSGSVGTNFQKQLTLVNNIVEFFGGVSQTGARAGLSIISTNSEIAIRLSDYVNKFEFRDAVSNVSAIYRKIPNISPYI